MPNDAVVPTRILVEEVELAGADPAELRVVGPLQAWTRQLALHVHEKVELATAVRSAVVERFPVAGVDQLWCADEPPAALLFDLSLERLEQGFARLHVAAQHVPSVGEVSALRAAAMHEHVPSPVADECAHDAPAPIPGCLRLHFVQVRQAGDRLLRFHGFASRPYVKGLMNRPAAES